MSETSSRFAEFFKGYCSAVAFTAHVDDEEGSGDPLFRCQGEFTDNYDGQAELSTILTPDELAELRADCAGFMELAGDLIEGREEEAGTDFHFSRNGHGAGFFDGDWGDIGDKLQAMAETFGSCELTGQRDDDGNIVNAYLTH